MEQTAKLVGAYQPDLFTATAKIELPMRAEDLCLFEDGKRLITTDDSNSYLWNTQTGDCIRTFNGMGHYNTAFFKNRLLKNNLYGNYFAKGSMTETFQGDFTIDLVYQKNIEKEKQAKESAFYLFDSNKKQVQRISPVDGSALWTYAYEDSGGRLQNVSSDGVAFSTNKMLMVLNPKTGNVIALIETEKIERITENGLWEADYLGNYLIVRWSKDAVMHFCVFQRKGSAFSFLFQKQITDSRGGGKTELFLDGETLFVAGKIFDDVMLVTPFFQAYDLRTGKLKWEQTEDRIGGGNTFLGVIRATKQSANTDDYAFAFVGTRFFLVNTETGELRKNGNLNANVMDLYYAKNGLLFLIDEEGHEYGFNIRHLEPQRKQDANTRDLIVFLNHDFSSSVTKAACCNNVYTIAADDEKTLFVYLMLENTEKSVFYQRDDEDNHSLGEMVLNPSKSLMAIKQFEPIILILDTETGKLLQTIDWGEEYFDEFFFFGDDRLAVKGYNNLRFYDVKTGKLEKTISKEEYNVRNYTCNSAKAELVFADEDQLWLLDDSLQMKPLIEKLDIDEENTSYSRDVRSVWASPSLERFAVEFYENTLNDIQVTKQEDGTKSFSYTPGPQGYSLGFYDRQKNELTVGALTEDYTTFSFETCAWSEDEKTVYFLKENQITGYDAQSGTKLCDVQYQRKIVDLLMLKDKLCLLDESGNLLRVQLDGETVVSEETLSLGLDSAVSGYLNMEMLSDGTRGILRYHKTAWLMDLEKFEIIYAMEGYQGLQEDRGLIYSRFYNYMYTYPLLTADDIAARARAQLSGDRLQNVG